MAIQTKLADLLEKVSQLAQSIQRKISYLIVLGFLASGTLAWQLYSIESTLWWNVTKCGLVMLPVLVFCFIWSVLNQLQDAPKLVSTLIKQDDGVFENLQSLGFNEPDGFSGLISTVRSFRQEDGLSVVFDTIGGVTLLANPLFLGLSFVCVAILIFFILITPFVVIF